MSALQRLIQGALDAQPGLTVADISRKAELTSTLIYGWLNGSRIVKTPMRPDTVAGLARGLGVPEIVIWQAVLKDLGVSTDLIEDISPEKAVLISSLSRLPDAEVRRVTAIVQQFMDED